MARVFLRVLTLTLISSFAVSVTYASPCCGQNASDLGVMTQGQRISVILNQLHASAIGRVYQKNNDFFVWPDSKERTVDITQLKLGLKLKDHVQTFLSTAYQSAHFKDLDYSQASSRMMDTVIGLTFEVLPEYTFTYYRPTVYLSVFANLPTGTSMFEGSLGPENIRVTGHGQWGTGLGLTLNKVILPWTIMVQAKTLNLFATDFHKVSVGGFFDNSAQIVLGYSLPFWSVSLNLALTQLDLSERKVDLRDQLRIPNSRSTSLAFGLVKPINEKLVLSITYSDQSLLGRPKNSILAQTFSFGITFNQ